MTLPTYAHFPIPDSRDECRFCGHFRAYQPVNVKKEPVGERQYWCAKTVEFVGAREQANGSKPRGVGYLNPSARACKYFLRGGVKSCA